MVFSDHDAQVFWLWHMRAHSAGNLWFWLRNMPEADFPFFFLNSLINVSLVTAPTFRTPRCSRMPLWAIISWMRALRCFRFTFPLPCRRIGWCMSSTILLSGSVSRCPHNRSRPALELGLSVFHYAHRNTTHSSYVSKEAAAIPESEEAAATIATFAMPLAIGVYG